MKSLIRRRLTQDVTLHLRSAGSEDDHGNPTDEETPMSVRGFATSQTRHEGGTGEIQGEALALFLEPDAPVDGWDAVTVGGVRYEVVGPPWRVYNPRTQEHTHIRADISKAGT